MYNGVLTEVQLIVHKDLIEEIFDKFGEKQSYIRRERNITRQLFRFR